MSLKAFHIFFVTVSVLVAFGFSVWGFLKYADQRHVQDLCWGALGLAAGVGLICYGKYMLKKLKDISYL
jgi:hypothetical protein